jgi:predicted dehydrogenase
MEKIRWGIIGCGNVTEMKSGPAFNKVPHSVLMGVMRRDEALLKDYASRHNVPYAFTNATDLINHPEIDAVYIATPPNVHEAYAIEALRANKMVYVEKPMATSVAACLRMQEVANEINGKLVIAHYRRALPLFLKVKALLEEKYIGKINAVHLTMHKKAGTPEYYTNNWRVDKEMAGGGLFYDLAPHQLDLVLYFFGQALSFSGNASNKGGFYAVEDTVHGEILLENNIRFQGDWCFAIEDNNEKDEFKIIGDLGTISFPVFGHMITIEKNGVKEQLEFNPPMHNQQNLIEKCVSYFLGQGENPCTANDAIQSMRIMEAFVYGNNK